MSGLRDLPPRTLDRLLAFLVWFPTALEALIVIDGGDRAIAATAVTLMAGSLAFRRRAPLPALTVFLLSALTMINLVGETENLAAPFLGVLVWAYAIGSLPEQRTALVGLAMIYVGIAGVSAAFSDPVVGDFIFPMGFATAAWGAGRTIRHRTRLTAELHEAAVRAEEDREAQAAQAVADERRRIAREMHDVVAHSVSVMVVQAGGARRVLERDPERAVEAARLIERTGRSALLEMRRLLGVLGSADEPAAMAPQPTLDGISGLVERACDAGLPVTMRVEGDRRPLPAGAEAAVYRVVQEALTNALKHAGRAPTEVVLRWEDEALEVVVADRGGAGAALPSGGHGIVGMRERVRTYGGELSAVPRPDGGFVVRARIPLDPAELQVV